MFYCNNDYYVTTCVVVWIEMFDGYQGEKPEYVTTCVVVWIEISVILGIICLYLVTTCVVVWIEIVLRILPIGGD